MAPPFEISLPPPDLKGKVSLEKALSRRRSIREFTPGPLSLAELSQMLWAAQGVTEAREGLRTAPSAGATYPLEIFAVCGADGVKTLEAGIYRYIPGNHSLVLHHKGDVRLELARAEFNQRYTCEAPVNIAICALLERIEWRYADRSERYVNIEVGHAGQNIYLQASALRLGTVAIGAFHDERVREVLRLDEKYRPLYIMPVGRPLSPFFEEDRLPSTGTS